MNGQVLDAASDRRFRFAHDKLREFAYADTPHERRRELHMRAALFLEARHESASTDLEVVTSLLQHLRFADRGDKLLHFLSVAGELALAQSAHSEAVEFLREAIALEERQSHAGRALRLARWERQVGEALQGLGDLVESMNHLERAATHLGRPLFVDTLELAPRLGYQVLVQAMHRLAPRRILELKVRDDPKLLESARIHDLLLQVCLHRGDVVRGIFACLNTLNLTEVTRDSPARAVAYANGQLVAGLLPWRGLTEAYGRHAKATLRLANDPLAASYHHLTEGAYRSGTGEWREAREELERALELAEEINFSRRAGDVKIMLGTLANLTGEFDEAHAQASRVLTEHGAQDTQLAFRGRLGRAQVAEARGRFDVVLEELESVAGFLAVVGIPDRIWAHGLCALANAKLERWKEAEAAAEEALFQQKRSPLSAHHAVAGYVAAARALLLLWETEKQRVGARAPTTRERRRACLEAVRAVAGCARVYTIARPSLELVRGHVQRLLDRPNHARERWQIGLGSATKLRMPYQEAQLHLARARLTESISPRERQAASARARQLLERLGSELP
jgi:tetratricopeptide (TPR) repeat protein